MDKRLNEIYGFSDVLDLEHYIAIIPCHQINVYKGFVVYGELYGAKSLETINIRAPSDDFATKEDIIKYIKTGINEKFERQQKLVHLAKVQIEFANKMEKNINKILNKKGGSCQIIDNKNSAKVRETLSDWMCQKYNIKKEQSGDTITFFN